MSDFGSGAITVQNNWKECKLGDICTDISYGYTASTNFQNIGPKFLRITDIVPNIINWEDVPFCKIDDKKKEQYKLEIDDIVIARTGATTGYNKITKDDVDLVFASYLIRYKIDKLQAYPKFIGYCLQSSEWKGFVEGIIGGSAQLGANAKQFASYDISLPPLEEQKAIAEILSSLDQKIDLLHRQNKTLEELPQTVFRQWFIEEAEDDWEEVKLSEFLIAKKGKNITKAQAIEGGYPVVAGGLEPSCYHNQNNTKSPVITISASGANAGFIRLYHTPVWASDCSYIDETITDYVYFFYVFLKYNQEALSDKQEGSAQPHIYPSHINDLDILKYPIAIIESFENQAKDIFSKIRENQKQIQTLENLRDTLLPKLLSGDIKVEI